MAASDGNAFDKSTCRKTCTQNDEEEREGRTFFFQQKEEENAKLQPLKQTAKIIMQPLKLIAIHLLFLISFYFSLHTIFLHFSHTYKLASRLTDRAIIRSSAETNKFQVTVVELDHINK